MSLLFFTLSYARVAQDIKLCFELITHCLAACQNNIQFPSIVIFRFSVRTFQLCRNNLTTPVLVWVALQLVQD